jgi:hypothetical protein
LAAINPRELQADAPSAEAGQPTTEGGDALCRSDLNQESSESAVPSTACSPAPSPTGGGAEERYEKFERESAEWSARVQASIDALTQPAQPGWQALAGDLAEVVAGAIEELSSEGYDVSEEKAVLARYHEAAAQHGEEEGRA